MATDCGGICAKFMLIVFNIIYLAVGGVILGVGIWFKVDSDAYQFEEVELIGNTVLGNRTFGIAVWILIAFGAFIFLFGGFGLFATILESTWMLALYILILVTLFALEIAFGTLALIYREEIEDELRDKLGELSTRPYYTQDNGTLTPTDAGKVLNFIQVEFSCCGINTFKEYTLPESNFSGSYAGVTVPYSCCYLKPGVTSWKDVNSADSVIDAAACQALNYTRGFHRRPCFDAAERWLEEREVIIIGIAFGLATFQIFGFIFSVCLCLVTRNKDDDDD